MKADAKTEAGVMATLNKMREAYVKRDLAGVLALYVPDPDLVCIGTGVDEKWIALDELKAGYERDFAQAEAVSLEWGWHSISAQGSVAWVAVDGTLQAKVEGRKMSLPLRFTAVLVKHGNSWLVAQAHNSMPAAGQSEGKSFPT